MTRFILSAVVILSLSIVSSTRADDWKPDDGFMSPYNGKDLTGWCYSIDGKVEKFDGKTEASDGRYTAKPDNIIVVNALPAGAPRVLRQLQTVQEFNKDFVFKVEFRAAVNADSGIFFRGKQLQCRDYLVAGPYKQLKNYKPQDWNTIIVTVKGKTAHCECNGEVLEDKLEIPATGGIGFEADRGQMEYRHIQIKEAK